VEGHRCGNEALPGRGVRGADDFRYHEPLACQSADHRDFPCRPVKGRAFGFRLVPLFAAHIRFIDFHLPHQLGAGLRRHRRPDPVTHRPRRAVRLRPDHPMNLQRTHPLFTLTQPIDHLEPDGQGILRILEQRAHQRREAVSLLVALLPLAQAHEIGETLFLGPKLLRQFL
jgi:hypothetical protein